MDEMTMDQIALAAECVTMARVEFVSRVFLDPILTILGGEMKNEPETEAARQARTTRKGKATRTRTPKKPKMTPEQRDQRILAMAARFGIEVVDAPPSGGGKG